MSEALCRRASIRGLYSTRFSTGGRTEAPRARSATGESGGRAFAAAFGVEKQADGLVECVAGDEILDRLLLEWVEGYERIRSPFDGILEAPQAVGVLYEAHAPRIDRGIAAARENLAAMLADLLAATWGIPTGAVVMAADVRAVGFDPAEREPVQDYDDW